MDGKSYKYKTFIINNFIIQRVIKRFTGITSIIVDYVENAVLATGDYFIVLLWASLQQAGCKAEWQNCF